MDGAAEPISGASLSVSVVLPTLNEREYIRDCLDSLAAQTDERIVEVLVVDGGSTDGTTDIAAQFSPLVRVVPNPRVTAAAAMNIGIAAASGTIIVRADAHTVYAPDYVERCVSALEETGAAVVGGPMRPVGLNNFGRAVAAVTSSPFGVGPGRFHYATEAQAVDTVYLGAFRPVAVTSVGGYDEVNLQWAAEDQELNFRIRQAGGRIWLDPTIRSWYFPRQAWRPLLKQYRNYGICKASTLKKHRELPSPRPMAPAVLVLVAGMGAVVGLITRRPAIAAAAPVSYALASGALAVRLADDPGVAPHRAWIALATCHWGYGAGFWTGILRILTRRPFDTRPTKGR